MSKKTAVAVLIFFLGAGVTSLAGATRIYVFGQGLFFYSSGSEGDYIPGKNDFPSASPHQSCGPGFRITAGNERFYLGLEGQYHFSSAVTLTDPSDGDTVAIDTYPHLAGYVLAGMNMIQTESIRVFVNAGGGVVHALNVENRKYTSDFGYETLIDPPDSKSPFGGFGGLGADFRINSQIGLFLEGRYQYIDSDQPQTLLSLSAGVSFIL
jgi:hypothetical protein